MVQIYDDPKLQNAVLPFIVSSVRLQVNFGLRTDVAICLGTGKNFKVFSELNTKEKFFDKVIPIEHPRFIIQYRRCQIDRYTKKYLGVLTKLTAGENNK